MSVRDCIETHIMTSLSTIQGLSDFLAEPMETAAAMVAECLLGDGKLLACGNAGSAAQSQQFVALMLNGFERERPGLPAIALSGDVSTVTAIAHDHRLEEIFAKQVRALGHPGDVLLVYTIGGNEPNILSAVNAAHDREMKVVALTGCDGGALTALLTGPDVELRVTSDSAARTQEAHLLITHCLCDLIDHQLFG